MLESFPRVSADVMDQPSSAIALCALGLEKVCTAELERLGFGVEGREPGRVRFFLAVPNQVAAPSGPGSPGPGRISPAGLLTRANLCLRTAERVLVQAGRFAAPDFDALYQGVRSIPWELYLRREDGLSVERVRTRSSALAAQTSVQSIAHKAAYDRLCSFYRLTRMPETGRRRSLRIYIEDDECVVGLDTSGEALHRRGYRKMPGQAPLKETVAAGILLMAGWSRRHPLVDPFCGSGTIAIEAALFAMDRAPGLDRSFAFEDMPFAERRSIEAEVEAARSRVRLDADFRILASDADPAALSGARTNAAMAGLSPSGSATRPGGKLEFRTARAEDAEPEYEEGYLLCNPPYGERLGDVSEAEALYGRIGETARRFSGWSLGFVTNRADFGDFFGRAASVRRLIVNGAEEQWFHWYPHDRPKRSDSGSPRKAGHPGSIS
jgi:putative N6-adenine-specific DNA methylase